MEFHKRVGYEILVHELEYDMGYIGCAVVYRRIGDVIHMRQLRFGDDHVFVTREEAERVLRVLAVHFIEGELFSV